MHSARNRVRLYVSFVAVGALGLIGLSASDDAAWTSIGLLAVLFWLCASLSSSAGDKVTVSTSFAVGMAAVLLLGPFGAGVVCIVGALRYQRALLPIQRVFNGTQLAVAALVAGLVYTHLPYGPTRMLDGSLAVGRLLYATVVVTATYYIINATLVAIVVSLDGGLPVGRVWWGSISWASISYLAYGLFGLLMAVLWAKVSIAAGVLVLVPLLVARLTFAQYAAEQAAYDSTVRSLIHAVETKDYYTSGHSERVSRATVLIAREWGMREDRVHVIRYAGLLHDVGKLGVPTKVLQKQGKLNDAEFDAIKLHPMRGYEMLREITFLKDALTGVVHHHERLDGRGYPMGLTGPEIPEFARIIMVADAFDSMTSTRSYRSAKSVAEAIAELRKWQGSQFDPAAVDALVRALEKNEWEPHPEEYHGELVARDGTQLPRPTGTPDPASSMPSQAS